MGMLIKKEYLATSFLFFPHKSPAQMVAPLLDIPGKIAMPCASPIISAVFLLIGLSFFIVLLLIISLTIISTAVSIKQTGKKSPLKDLSTKPLNKSTMAIVGKVEIIKLLPVSPNGRFITSTTSFFKTIITENKVAKWRIIDKSKKSLLIPKNLFNKTKWPLDETGKNSVSPWTTAKIIINQTKSYPFFVGTTIQCPF